MERRKGIQEKMADAVTAFTGSVLFAHIHVIWFLAWLVINLEWTSFPAFDPFPFGLLTMIVSLEAIFLSTFVLISQNRMSQMSERRSDLDLQVNLLAEYEITKLLRLADAMADHFHLKEGRDRELEQLKVEIQPQDVLQEMERGSRHVL